MKKDKIKEHEIWDLKNTICLFVLPRLRIFIEKVENDEFLALPEWVNDNGMNFQTNREELKQKWLDILNNMAISFDYCLNPNNYNHLTYEDQQILFENGLQLFAKYFIHLWD